MFRDEMQTDPCVSHGLGEVNLRYWNRSVDSGGVCTKLHTKEMCRITLRHTLGHEV